MSPKTEMKSRIVLWAVWLAAVLALQVPPPAYGTVVANNWQDFKPGTYQGDTTYNPSSDTLGTGKWTYQQSTTANPGSGTLNDLVWTPTFLDGAYSLSPQSLWVSIRRDTGTDYLTMHPGYGTYAALGWEAGTGEAGLTLIKLHFSKSNGAPDTDGTELYLFVNGTQALHQQISHNDTVGFDYDIYANLEVGSKVYAVVGWDGLDSGGRPYDDDTSFLTMTMETTGDTAGVPEPSQVAMSLMVLLGAGGVVLRQKFFRQAAK
jgi:hypothetical protein